MVSHLLKQIITGKEACNIDNLADLRKDELECIAILLGCPQSGTKILLAQRIVDYYKIRSRLVAYKTKNSLYGYREIIEMERQGKDLSFLFRPDPGIEQMVKDFTGKDLLSMCRIVKCGVWGCKRQKAANLLNWRNRCRKKGLQAHNEAMKEIRENPRQIQLKIWAV